jgi:hypothetical protein
VGSWLARKIFTIGTQKDSSTFKISDVEPDYFEARGLPKDTTYLVEIHDVDLNQSCEFLPELVKVSLTKSVHAALARDQESAAAQSLYRGIYVDVVTTVLATGYANLGGANVIDGGILAVVTDKLSKATGVSPERLRSFASETAGSKLRSVVQAQVDLSHAFVSALQRK